MEYKDSKVYGRLEHMRELLDDIREQSFYNGQIVENSVKVCEGRTPEWDSLPYDAKTLGLDMRSVFGVERLYRHQVSAIKGYLEGRNVVLNTSTSSGKSLVYQLVIINGLVKNNESCYMVIFPTKVSCYAESLKVCVREIDQAG